MQIKKDRLDTFTSRGEQSSSAPMADVRKEEGTTEGKMVQAQCKHRIRIGCKGGQS
jgi:hypothetical protein